MSGLNSNMNHSVHRLTSRVLAPPGGHSSLSLGHSFTDVAPSSRAKPVYRPQHMPAPVAAVKTNLSIPGLENHYSGPSYYDHEEEEEEADERAYSYRQQPQTSSRAMYPTSSRIGHVPLVQQVTKPIPTAMTPYSATRALTAVEYAGELRRQILEKKQRDCMAAVERTGNERRGLLTKEDVLQARMEAHVRNSSINIPGPASSRRSSGVYAPSAGGWSISGN